MGTNWITGLHLNIRIFFTVQVMVHWSRVPREAVESSPWGSSKATWTRPWAPCSGVPAGTGAGGDEPRGLFPHQPCWDTVTPPFWFALLKRTTKSWFLSQIWLLVPWPPPYQRQTGPTSQGNTLSSQEIKLLEK